MNRFFSRFSNLETILWILASVAAFLAFLVFVPSFLTVAPGSETAGAARPTSTPRPTLTPLPTATSASLPPPSPKASRLVPFPTEPPNAKTFAFTADPRRTGWLASGESDLHFGDRNLHAGTYRGQTFLSVLNFDLAALAPGSRVLYAQVELAGLNRNNLGNGGTWTLQLLSSSAGNRNVDLRSVAAQANIGDALTPDQLNESQTNQFVFSRDHLSRLDEVINTTGRAYFRLNGPAGPTDNLFTWDAGDRDPAVGVHPILRVLAIPAQFTVITNTPTPENVLTAAAALFQATETAKRGTPTSLSRQFATSTPQVIVTAVPTPANPETATAVAAFATAIAVTTGTYTPTPLNWITATPQPLFVPVESFSPTPTPTPTISKPQLARKSFPPGLAGKIMFLSGPREAPTAYIMDANGKNVAQITDRELYDIAATRDMFSPSGAIEAFNAPDPNNRDILQIFLYDYTIPGSPTQPNYNQMTFLRRGIAFSPSWSPDSKKIAYASTETGYHEIYAMEVDTKRPRQLTYTNGWNWNQYPSWSPDGKQIVYATDRGRPNTFTDIWVMNADGTGAYKLLDWGRDAWAPVWIKWNR